MDINANISQVNSVIGAAKAAELVAYAHATLFSLALEALQKALRRGYICNFPSLTAKMLQRHPPQSIATAKGHLDQIQQNLHLTDMTPNPIQSFIKVDHFWSQKFMRQHLRLN
jgi:hypothetical protein